MGYGHNGSQHEPRHNIPGSSSIKSELPKIGTAHIALLHDARQYGEGCNTHRNTDKKSQGEEGNFGGIALIRHNAQYHAQNKGDKNTGLTYYNRVACLGFNIGNSQLHPNGKHKEDKAELTQKFDIDYALLWEKPRRKIRSNNTQETRTQQDAGNNLPNNRRLPEAGKKPSHPTSYRQDNHDLEQQTPNSGSHMVLHPFAKGCESPSQTARRASCQLP